MSKLFFSGLLGLDSGNQCVNKLLWQYPCWRFSCWRCWLAMLLGVPVSCIPCYLFTLWYNCVWHELVPRCVFASNLFRFNLLSLPKMFTSDSGKQLQFSVAHWNLRYLVDMLDASFRFSHHNRYHLNISGLCSQMWSIVEVLGSTATII